MSELSDTMKKEVNRILDGIKDVKEEERYNYYNIVLTFTSTLVPTLKVILSRELKSLVIEQNFIDNFTDKITAELELDTQELLSMYYLRKELMCQLSITKLDPHVKLPEHRKPFYEKTYRCVILNARDIFKQISTERILPNNSKAPIPDYMQSSFGMKIELIDDTVYDARKGRLNLIARNCRIKDVMLWAINELGIKKAAIVEPDNDHLYLNFVIPPLKDITNIMSFFQNAPGMGVYYNGFCSYITEDCWFVWPRYGEPVAKRPIIVYGLGPRNYDGLDRYDWKEEDTRHILINSDISETNWSILGSENKVNAANVQQATKVMDTSRTIVDDDKFEMAPVINNYVSIPLDAMKATKCVNVDFFHDHANIFTIHSDIGAYQTTTLGFTWKNAEPFAFTPSTVVKYNYDHKLGYKSMAGMCEKATYTFTFNKGTMLYPFFACNADVVISCHNKDARDAGNT